MKTKAQRRKEAVELLRNLDISKVSTFSILNAALGGDIHNDTCYDIIIRMIDLLEDDELTEDDYLELLKDAVKDYVIERDWCKRFSKWYNNASEKNKELYSENRRLEHQFVNGVVCLPEDADGVHIDVCNLMTVRGYRPAIFRVTKLIYLGGVNGESWSIVTRIENPMSKEDEDEEFTFYPNQMRHYHPPKTVEEVLTEFAEVGIRICAKDGINVGKVDFEADDEMVKSYAKYLTLKED